MVELERPLDLPATGTVDITVILDGTLGVATGGLVTFSDISVSTV